MFLLHINRSYLKRQINIKIQWFDGLLTDWLNKKTPIEYKNSHFCQSIFSITEVFRRIIQVYLGSVFNDEIVAWYIFHLNRRPVFCKITIRSDMKECISVWNESITFLEMKASRYFFINQLNSGPHFWPLRVVLLKNPPIVLPGQCSETSWSNVVLLSSLVISKCYEISMFISSLSNMHYSLNHISHHKSLYLSLICTCY